MKKVMIIVGIVICGVLGVSCSGAFLQQAVSALESDVCKDGEIADDLKEIAGCNLESDDTAVPMVISLVEVVLSIVGIITVVMVVYGGITYVISTGDAMKIRRAQNTILYGIVGMVIASVAYAIVYFVSQAVWGGKK